MRNLQILRKFISGSPLPLPNSSVFCIGENGYLFDVIGLESGEGDNCEHFLSNLARVSEFAHIEELVKSNFLQDIFHMQFISNTGCLYLGTKRGQFLQFYLHVGDVEELFQSETGLATFAVSPDSRFVSIVTRSGILLLLSLPNLELVFEEVLFDSKQWDNSSGATSAVQLCWRHDSQYFVVNIPDEKTGRRLKIYDERGMLFSSTEDSTHLVSDVVTWQPSGGLLAAIEKPPTGKDGFLISFFELNGLKRSSFNPIEGKKIDKLDDIVSLSWNSSSDLLAVTKLKAVELWHRSNYAWMCKYVIQRNYSTDGIKFFAWDRENPYKLYIVFESGYYSFYDFNLTYSSGYSGGSALTVSINGANLYCTPFRDNSAPPPYGFFQISVESAVKEVVISSFWDGFLCILFTGNIILVKNSGTELSVCKKMIIENEAQLRSSYNWTWPNIRTLCCINENRILVFQLPEDIADASALSLLSQTQSIPMNCSSISVVREKNLESDNILIRKHGGSILLLNLQYPQNPPKVIFKVPSHCFHNIKYLFFGAPVMDAGDDDELNRMIIIGHDHATRKLEIFLGTKASLKLAADCTSTAIFDDNLLFTTIQGTLEIVHVSELEKALTASTNGTRAKVEQYSRKVEKGSVILTCCLNQLMEPTLVIQVLPRGNIETIHPRPLVIASIKTLLRHEEKRSFSVIMGAMRRHRIDSNILLDELKLIEKEGTSNLTVAQAFRSMVEDVKDSNILVLLVTEVNSNHLDSLILMKSVLKDYTESPSGKNGIQPYLATMAKLGLYEEILNSQHIIGEEDREVVKSRVKFLSFYADNADTLYEAALGTYDLSLTAIVADCLNKDPKEYLPILNNLRVLPSVKRCFVIDNSLKRWVKGLRSLLEDSSVQVEEIVKYVEKHRLFPDALSILAENSVSSARDEADVILIQKALQNSYGQYLEQHGKLHEASIMYKRAGCSGKAIECSVRGGCWESALPFIEDNEENKLKVYHDILSTLQHKQEWTSAARLCELYLADYRQAIEFWIQARKWISAHALTTKDPNLKDMTSRFIKPKLVEHEAFLEENLKNVLQSFRHHIFRFRTVRLRKEAKKLAGNEEAGDNFSDTDSVSSTSSVRSSTASSAQTGKTYRSGKNKRKLERKLYSLKEGSRYEDVAIAIHLWEAFTRLHQEMKPDVAQTSESLWRFELDQLALRLTSQFDELVSEVDNYTKEIWSSSTAEDFTILDSKYRVCPVGWTAGWDKLSFLPPTSLDQKCLGSPNTGK